MSKGMPTANYENKLKTLKRDDLIEGYGKIKVGLIGDSIRDIGYSTKLDKYLGDNYYIYKNDENCRFAQFALRVLFDHYNEFKTCDIITFNAGLWDICKLFDDGLTFTDINVYKDTIIRLAKLLLNICKNVFFITTTPVSKLNIYNSNSDIIEFNNAVVDELKALGIKIIDLYSIINKDIDKYICSDTIHLSNEGIDVACELIAKSIKEVKF